MDANELENRVLDQLFEQRSLDPETYSRKIMNPDKFAKELQALKEKKAALQKELKNDVPMKRLREMIRNRKYKYDPDVAAELSTEVAKERAELNREIAEVAKKFTDLNEIHERAQEAIKLLLKVKGGGKGAIEQIIKAIRELEPKKKAKLFRALCRGYITVAPASNEYGYLMMTRVNLKATIHLKAPIIYELVGNALHIESPKKLSYQML
ncbi:MAG: hypothetical protein WBD99_17110 [Thermodesulfobacteriota bacterium]